jgi:transcriptional regulator with XRE-family HTH domain
VSAWATTPGNAGIEDVAPTLAFELLCCPIGQQCIRVHIPVKGGVVAQPAFGFLLQRLREHRGLSLRELAQLASIDHAYIYRLETGDKESPSEEVVTKLVRALKVGKREADLLHYLADHPHVDVELAAHALADATVTIEEFSSVAGVAFRGAGRPDYPKLFERVRRILQDENANR